MSNTCNRQATTQQNTAGPISGIVCSDLFSVFVRGMHVQHEDPSALDALTRAPLMYMPLLADIAAQIRPGLQVASGAVVLEPGLQAA